MTLPTFSELMASLQLSNTGEPEQGGLHSPAESSSSPLLCPSPSGSLSPTATCQHPLSNGDSPSIVISQFEPNSRRHSEPRGSQSLGRSNRFAPYLGATSNHHSRRCSLTDVSPDVLKRDIPPRPSSASPCMHPNTLRDVSINSARPTRQCKLVDIDTQSDVPISSFVRRRTPQSSPTMTTFPQRRRSVSSQDSLSPVLLPTLPPGLTVPSPITAELMDVSEIEDVLLPHPTGLPKPRHRHQGLRLSSYRSTSQLQDVKDVSSLRPMI